MRRGVGIVLLLLLAALGGVLGVVTLANLFADYQDSPDSTYFLVGLPFVFISIASLARLLSLLRSGWRRPLMALVGVSCAAALGIAVAGSLELGSPLWEKIAVPVMFLLISIGLLVPWHRDRRRSSGEGTDGGSTVSRR